MDGEGGGGGDGAVPATCCRVDTRQPARERMGVGSKGKTKSGVRTFVREASTKLAVPSVGRASCASDVFSHRYLVTRMGT